MAAVDAATGQLSVESESDGGVMLLRGRTAVLAGFVASPVQATPKPRSPLMPLLHAC